MLSEADLTVSSLGPCAVRSPLALSTIPGDEVADFVPDDMRVLLAAERRARDEFDAGVAFEKAGPRETIFFPPQSTRAAIVTCGGLCPGLNHVIRSIVLELFHNYGVKKILGYRYGYDGLNPSHWHVPVELAPEQVRSIHRQGGSFLGVSRGAQPVDVMVDTLETHDVQILFAIGGDGTLKGAHAICEEIAKRGRRISVVCVPKTIDNDIAYVDKTFGFDTAVEVAKFALDGAHTEAISAYNGVGLVKVMGRDSGFIAAAATLASLEVNYCLVPEVHFDLDGEHGLLVSLAQRLKQRSHALIVVAEGCTSVLSKPPDVRDASGSIQYSDSELDVGACLKSAISAYFKRIGMPITLKCIDPSYMIRSVPANANDSIFCDILARQAVHAAMAGKTDVVIGRWHNIFTHVPLAVATAQRKKINPDSGLWLAVTETTGQPHLTSSIPVSARPSRRPAVT